MKNRLLGLISFATLLGVGCLSNVATTYQEAKGIEVSLSNDGDYFTLLDDSYTAEESFVYTADIHFNEGQAGGLVFGAEENSHYFVINMDRYENRTKLLYFANRPEGGYNVDELYIDDFIGNDKMTNGERELVNDRVRNKVKSVNIKLILTVEEEHTYAEFFLDGIKRFGIDTVIDLSNIPDKSYVYEGGRLGFNCFNSNITAKDIEIGKSDYSYMSEQYRNQFHLSPFAHWTNDPNALVYFNGYYHCYYQTNPFGQYWDEMFWGHARSIDLIHWEFLPICLFPENYSEFGSDRAFMWSGCAVAYYKGMSAEIDALNWFPQGNGDGIYAVFTRDGALQDQVIMSSDDNGFTWTKRIKLPQSLSGYEHRIDYRDPKVFPVVRDGEKVTMWGMTLSSMNLSKGFFLSSPDLIHWSPAGVFNFPRPECIGVGEIKDPNGDTYHYLTNKSRTYLLGHMTYDFGSNKIVFKDLNGVDITTYGNDEASLELLDFGPDTYASQSFYITDPSSEYCGKDIVINWFSGDLNASFCTGPGEYANIRDGWNGGFTMPVEYSVKYIQDKPVIAQTPITLNNAKLEKENIVSITNKEISSTSENVLENVHTNTFELQANIKNTCNSPIIFKVNVSENEYMEFGWNSKDGYYVDRSNLDSKGINTNIDWHAKYASKILGDSDVKSFYVLGDNGGLEVFCEDFKISFYFVTIPSPFSNGASLSGDNLLIESLTFNEIKSIWRQNVLPGEGILRLSSDVVELDTSFLTSKYVSAYYTGSDEIKWEYISGEEVVDFTADNSVAKFEAKAAGEAFIKISAGKSEEILNIKVYSGEFKSDFTFSKENIKSGSWVMGSDKIIGENIHGNAFLLSNQQGGDFTYSGKFSILEGTAASLVFRSDLNMQQYLVLNYDSNEKVVKLWNENGEITRSSHIDVSKENIVLSVTASGRNVQASINGNKVIAHELAEGLPLSGYFGLNVFSAKAEFKSLSLLREEYEYVSGNGLDINLDVAQNINAIYNMTNKNTLIDKAFYTVSENKVHLDEEYFETLKETKIYQFKIVGELSSFTIKVDVKSLPIPTISDITVEEGHDVVIYLGNIEVNSIKINGNSLESSDYKINGTTLSINKNKFAAGENEVVINDQITFKVTIKVNTPINNEEPTTQPDYLPLILGSSIGGGTLLVGGVALALILILKKKKGGIVNG